jgi:Pentapeptide repeats (8 copies)
MPPSDPLAALQADCARCRALCCVGPAFGASADFALDKPAGQPCTHLGADDRCRIHAQLRPLGFPGCVAYDCFGAGQHVVQVTFGGAGREPVMFPLLPIVRALHELLWYLAEVQERAAPVRDAARAATDRIARLTRGTPDALRALDLDAERAAVDPLLRRASALVRSSHRNRQSRGALRSGAGLARRDLAGADLRAARLSGADLRGTLLIGANLRDADLRDADLIGTDLRAADLRGTDLTGALFLTRGQLQSAAGDASTRIPDRLARPAHWRSAREEVEQQ